MSSPTPMKLLREFSQGNWTNMLAEKYGMSEGQIECLLMDAARELLARARRKG